MNVAWKQEDFHRIIDQSSITEPDLDSISEALHVICDPGDVHEVRVLDTNLGVLAGWFDDLEAMSQAILDLTRGEGKYEGKYGFKALTSLPESVYVSLNPVSEDLLALVGNRIKVCDTTTKDHDIVAIKRLFLDGDPWRRKGVSSTDEGHSLAISKMKEIRDYLTGMGFPRPCLADSGNGAHLIHATLLDNTPDDRALVEAYVKAVSLRFGVPCKHGEKSQAADPWLRRHDHQHRHRRLQPVPDRDRLRHDETQGHRHPEATAQALPHPGVAGSAGNCGTGRDREGRRRPDAQEHDDGQDGGDGAESRWRSCLGG